MSLSTPHATGARHLLLTKELAPYCICCRFQLRAQQQNAIKAKTKRRLAMGFREAKKFLQLDRVKCLIVAPDISRGEAEGG